MKLTTLALCFTLLFAFFAQAQTSSTQEKPLSNTVAFFGLSADPNGGTNDIAIDTGGAKLVGSNTYLGLAAHVSRSTDTTKRISTKLQFHAAQKLTTFRGSPLFWTCEVGPDFVASQAVPVPPATVGPMTTSVGYAIGSGPLLSVPVSNKGYSLGFHAEITKGSMSDTGWRGGILFILGSN